MSRKKKTIIFLSVVAILFYVSVGCGLMREDSDMDKAMHEVKEIVAQTREDIEAEMNKPFYLRIFGSLFGMEGNSFQGLKEDLPAVIKDAMPSVVGTFSFTSSADDICCDGMRLTEALELIESENVELDNLYWSFDDTVVEEDTDHNQFILFGGTILQSEQTTEGINLTIQMQHPYDGENGIGRSDESKLSELSDWAGASSNQTTQILLSWLDDENVEWGDESYLSMLETQTVDFIELEK